jgi:rod shape-determining protein MreB
MRKVDPDMNKDVVFIGMDLGTFKTSVASSTGNRDAIPSSVGWPRDAVARTLLGRDVIFGKDVLEHRLALNVIRPFEKGVLKYNDAAAAGVAPAELQRHRDAARLLVDHAVALTRPPNGAAVYGVIGAPSRATIENKAVILEAAAGTFDAVMIVSEPFAVAYGMNRLNDTLVIDIGAGTIDLCPIHGTFPSEESQVTLPVGGDFVDEKLLELVRHKFPEVQVSLNMVREIKEKYGFVHNVNEKAVVTLSAGGKPKPFDLTDVLKTACSLIVPPIVDAVREVIVHSDPELQPRLLNNIVLAGGGSQIKGLDRVIEEALQEYGGAKVKRVYDALFAGAVGALKLALGMPRESWAELACRRAMEPILVG